jgi:3-dehydroquinate synthase
MLKSLKIKSKIKDYCVHFIDNLSEIDSLIENKDNIIIIDQNVNDLFFKRNPSNKFIVIKSDENIKSLESATDILKIFSDLKINSKNTIIVIGGGILQDLISFCASIYCRGIDYILVPTTLLSQTDSCVGGKTSINFNHKKNILGTFYPPKEILIYIKFAKTLSKLDLYSGIGEIYKFYILQDKIKDFPKKIQSIRTLKRVIHKELKFKISILKKDEFDKKERKFLNFGHTFAHALEISSGYKIPHGIAVIIGSMIAIEISNQFKNDSSYKQILEVGKNLINDSVDFTIDEKWFDFNILLPLIKSDKKNTHCINMVLMIDGNPELCQINDVTVLEKATKTIYESIRLHN